MTLKEKVHEVELKYPRLLIGSACSQDGSIDVRQAEDEAPLFLGGFLLPEFSPLETLLIFKECATILGADSWEVCPSGDGKGQYIHFYYTPSAIELQELKIEKARKELSSLESQLEELKASNNADLP